MSSLTSSSPKTPHCKRISWKHDGSPSFVGSPGCCSTPSTSNKKKGSDCQKVLWASNSPSKHSKVLGSPTSKLNGLKCRSQNISHSVSKENELDASASISRHSNNTDPSWSVKTFSSTESNGTVTVDLDFPQGGWNEDDDSSDVSSSCSLEIVESEVESNPSPLRHGRKRKQSEVSEEDSAILSGMGEEIERQLEAKAERNRLTVPNVKNILRSVITNPHVQAMVRRSIKSGDVAVLGDSDDISFEPRITRAKAKLLCDSYDTTSSDIAWATVPLKSQPPSVCQALINNELNDDSEDDEEYQPGEDEPSDYDCSERDCSERGSERDISMEQSPACVDTDAESRPATPVLSPKPHSTDSATQTNWSDDGIFKVPSVPSEQPLDCSKEENIALRTRSKLPLNDTPLEEIEQAFIPPDITPDLYDTTCDNSEWLKFLQEYLQPMPLEPETQNHDDDEEDPEYNVLADEEIIDKEELRRDRAVKVPKRELNELMRELMEFGESMTQKEDKLITSHPSPGMSTNNNLLGCNEEIDNLFNEYMSYGTLAPITAQKMTPPPSRSPGTPTLHTPVPPISPPCARTPCTARKDVQNDNSLSMNEIDTGESIDISGGKGKFVNSPSGKKMISGKNSNVQSSAAGSQSGKKQAFNTISEKQPRGKPDCFQNTKKAKGKPKTNAASKPDESVDVCTEGQIGALSQASGKLTSYLNECENRSCSGVLCDDMDAVGLMGANIAVPVTESNPSNSNKHLFSPGKEYSLLQSKWEEDNGNVNNTDHISALESHNAENNLSHCIGRSELTQGEINTDEELSSDAELLASLPVSGSPVSCVNTESETVDTWSDIQLTSNGDITVNNIVVLSAVQKLVLDQQMRQYVQITTQHFLQTYQHPVHSKFATACKERLILLQQKAKNRENSAFKPANLLPALDIVYQWEQIFTSSEGPKIVKFMEEQASKAKYLMSRKHRHVEKFSPQLMNLMANSTAFIYPQLLPTIPFRTIEMGVVNMLSSEEELLVIGLEEFTQFITENVPKSDGRCLRQAMNYVTEYLLVIRDPRKLANHIRRMKKPSYPIMYYKEHKCAPPTSHTVLPFQEQKVICLREQPHYTLPPVWRDFLYPARSS